MQSVGTETCTLRAKERRGTSAAGRDNVGMLGKPSFTGFFHIVRRLRISDPPR